MQKPKLNTLTMDYLDFGLDTVEKPEGYRWHYHNKVYYFYRRDPKGTLVPFEINTEISITPDALYQALFWKEPKKLLTPVSTTMEKITAGLMIAIIGISFMFLFLIMSSGLGW